VTSFNAYDEVFVRVAHKIKAVVVALIFAGRKNVWWERIAPQFAVTIKLQ
jgi:hypothetical protein